MSMLCLLVVAIVFAVTVGHNTSLRTMSKVVHSNRDQSDAYSYLWATDLKGHLYWARTIDVPFSEI
ncbi:hypothetical protein GCM10011410_03680 [Hoyosella rhizosphaerae]|uniref:Uncharacterized protein n=1 Tax=Hoyosella rhizosphaerae TaxID=1755582 RepID=A0A916U1H0_9ACTN|nr:hypothetical protein GCM10011410_03680 [Hoyosella rhizosphaerae]